MITTMYDDTTHNSVTRAVRLYSKMTCGSFGILSIRDNVTLTATYTYALAVRNVFKLYSHTQLLRLYERKVSRLAGWLI